MARPRVRVGQVFGALLGVLLAGSAAADTKAARARCLAAINADIVEVNRAGLKETMYVPIPEHSHLFQFTAADGGVFSCQFCDDHDPAAACPTMGIDLAYRAAGGELVRLPAELERKCLYDLQQELGTVDERLTIKYDLLERVKTTPSHTDTRFVYAMALDGNDYRCVIRKSDGSYRVEQREGEKWRALAAGTFFGG